MVSRTSIRTAGSTCGSAPHSQKDLILHFGLGQALRADVRIEWPSGVVQSFDDVATRALVLVDEERGILELELLQASARLSASAHTLAVRVQSNYGGRVGFTCARGPLSYDAASVSWRGLFPGGGVSAQLELFSERGDVFRIPVTLGP